MPRLKVPSLQHLARNWRSSPEQVAKLLVSLAKNGPTFNYEALFSATTDMLLFGQPLAQIEEGIRRGVRRADVRDNFLEVLPLLNSHFQELSPSYFQTVSRRFYPVGRSLLVPFTPPLIYGVNGVISFPWFSFWRKNPLGGEALSLFVTIVEELLLQDPDLEGAKFSILDFSVPAKSDKRSLIVLSADQIPRVSEQRKQEMLEIFASGFALARTILLTQPTAPPPAGGAEDPDQLRFL